VQLFPSRDVKSPHHFHPTTAKWWKKTTPPHHSKVVLITAQKAVFYQNIEEFKAF